MRVLFLDIDGVVLTGRFSFGPGKPWGAKRPADPDAVAALNRIVAETGAVIVVSSTWRYDYDLAEIRDALTHWGVRAEVIDAVPDLRDSVAGARVRIAEINAWLARAACDIESFAILDDDDGLADLAAHLVQTQFSDGLTMELAERAIALLKREGVGGAERIRTAE